LGVVIDKKKGIYRREKEARPQEKLILDFGDTYLINQFIKNIGLSQILEKIFDNRFSYLLALISYRLCNPAAM
jgi:hypothetical protein